MLFNTTSMKLQCSPSKHQTNRFLFVYSFTKYEFTFQDTILFQSSQGDGLSGVKKKTATATILVAPPFDTALHLTH